MSAAVEPMQEHLDSGINIFNTAGGGFLNVVNETSEARLAVPAAPLRSGQALTGVNSLGRNTLVDRHDSDSEGSEQPVPTVRRTDFNLRFQKAGNLVQSVEGHVPGEVQGLADPEQIIEYIRNVQIVKDHFSKQVRTTPQSLV